MVETLKQMISGLSGRIIGLVVVPIVILAGLGVVGMGQYSTLVETDLAFQQRQLKDQNEVAATGRELGNRMTALRSDVESFYTLHQRALLSNNDGLAGDIASSRENVKDSLNRLVAAIPEMRRTFGELGIEPRGFTPETRDSSDPAVQAAGRLAIALRMEKALPNIFDVAVEANARTLDLLRDEKFSQARDNLIFEENSRVDAFRSGLVKLESAITTLQQSMQRLQAQQLGAHSDDVRNSLTTVNGIAYAATAIIAIALIVAAAAYGHCGLSGPLRRMVRAMNTLTQGDTDIDLPDNVKFELRDMAEAITVFRDNQLRMQEMDAQQKAEQEEKERRTQEIEEMIRKFDENVNSVLGTFSTSSESLQSTATSMTRTAETTNENASSVASASEQASANVQSVASAAEELSRSVEEIGDRVHQTAKIARQANEDATNANQQIKGLYEAAQRVGEVVNLINDIAEQTNLLALNATIEAARAGDAGKGFAVVANEVKSLANQTGKATEEIAEHVRNIQNETNSAVTAIEGVTKTITEIDEISSNIASAVEQQTVSTQEIARNTQEAASGTQQVTENITLVTRAAQESDHSARDVLSAAEELQTKSGSLKSEISTFLQRVRAA